MNIITDKTVFGGNTLAKNKGKNIFIPYAIPEEELEIEIIESKRDYDIAKIKQIIKPSPHRVKPICKYYEICGGCNMMHIETSFQQEIRKNMLQDAFSKYQIDISNKIEIISGPEFNYRSRFQFIDGGLSQKSSNNIIKIDECLCAEKPINDYLKNTDFEHREKGRTHYFGSEKLINTNLIIEKKEQIQTKKTNPKNKKFKENHYFSGTILSEENTAIVELNGKQISFDVRGFFQSNLYVFEKVLKLICDSLPGGKNIVDIYSGCGSISAFLSDKYENVVLVEHNRDALVYAEKNMAQNKHTSYGLSGANWVKNCVNSCPQFDACVVDPPRSGMEKEVLDYLCKSKIPTIRSLSCDPSTHARDCEKLIKAGYELEKIYLLDFYNHTSHIESLAIFNLRT